MEEITENDFNCEQFKYSESNWLEFKQSLFSCPIEKIIETICAFLNTEGGYIIIGINDEEKLVGINSKPKNTDTFKLLIDKHISNNTIVHQNDEIIVDKYLSITDITNNAQLKFILIKIFPQTNKNYKLINGSIIHRLNASNRKIKSTKLMTESDYLSSVETSQRNIISKYNKLVQELNSEIKDLKTREKNYEKKITLLSSSIEVYNNIFCKFANVCLQFPEQFSMK